jgi:uncharacterized protein (TIGR02453 family)
MPNIHPDTFKFLKDLNRNNNRDWFHANKERYSSIREGFIDFLNSIYPELKSIDPGIEGVDMRKTLFRINRDVRFSDNKSPYKTTLASVIIEGGKRNFSEQAGFYIHLENGNSLIAGGAYMPPSPWIGAIRAKIDKDPDSFRRIIENKNYKDTFGELEGDRLKGAPRGYKQDNPNIELLRFKSYMAVRQFSEQDVLSDKFGTYLLDTARAVKPLNDYINSAR